MSYTCNQNTEFDIFGFVNEIESCYYLYMSFCYKFQSNVFSFVGIILVIQVQLRICGDLPRVVLHTP